MSSRRHLSVSRLKQKQEKKTRTRKNEAENEEEEVEKVKPTTQQYRQNTTPYAHTYDAQKALSWLKRELDRLKIFKIFTDQRRMRCDLKKKFQIVKARP